MGKKKAKTNAIRLLEQQKIPYEEHHYAWTEDRLDAEFVAGELAQEPTRVFKTLMAIGNKTGPIVAVVPSTAVLNLKKIAKVSGNKKVEMLPLKELENTTGYIRGGCSPVGMKKLFPTYLDASAEQLSTITVSAGKRGLQMALTPQDLQKVTKAIFADIAEKS